MGGQIFISYARDDNLVPPNLEKGKGGFITTLHDQLVYEFRNLGGTRPELWRDTRFIERGDQFEDLIEAELNRSDILLVVLSLNWIRSVWCQRELTSFQRRWGNEEVRHRIVIAAKRHVPFEIRPPALQGQEGYGFYFLEPGGKPGEEQEYFDRGMICDDRYYQQLRDLARFLSSYESKRGATAPVAPARSTATSTSSMAAQAAPAASATPPPTSAPTSAPALGTVFVAKPAADMRTAYNRAVAELQGRGYAVVPPPTVEIPNDSSAIEMIDGHLAAADLCVHLLGEKMGYAPEDADPIVKLQLARAALRQERAGATPGRWGEFRRIVWAPRVLTDDAGAAAAAASAAAREPMEVMARFDKHLPSDKVIGENLSNFVEVLIQFLSNVATVGELQPETGDAPVYVYHRPEDQDYALQIARLLQKQNLEPRLPAFEGDPGELSALHRQELQNCKSVVLCWANASEVWVKASARELAKWRELGRGEQFACRAVIACPPPGQRKVVLADFPPRNEIDMVVDLSACEILSAGDLDPIVRASRPGPR